MFLKKCTRRTKEDNIYVPIPKNKESIHVLISLKNNGINMINMKL